MRCPTLAELPKPPAGKTGWPWTQQSSQLADVMPEGRPWPRISIVTPLYNQQPFIEETIRSVLLQGYPDFEYIVVDAESTDGSLDVIEKYSAWVRCIVRKKEGQSAALNRGFKLATGELIGWQNSDDFYGQDNFKNCAHAALAYPDYDIYHGTVKGFSAFESRPPWLFEVCEEFLQASLLDRMCVMNQSMFFRRTIVEKGIFIDEDLNYAMDRKYFWRLSLDGFRYKLVPAMIGYYRQHAAAKSTNWSVRGNLEGYGILRWLCRDKRLAPDLRREARSRLRRDFASSLRKARRTVLRKLVPELILPV